MATEKLRAAGLRYQGMAKALHEFANVLEEEQQVGRRAAPRPKVPSPGGIMRNNSIKPRC